MRERRRWNWRENWWQEIPAGFVPLPLKAVELGPPVPKPSKIIAVGLNYRDHAGEANFKVPEYPLIIREISKFHCGTARCDRDSRGGHAGGFGGGIGGGDRAAREGDSGGGGVTITLPDTWRLNDVSGRKWQFADKQWTRGKSCDTFCPIGAVVDDAGRDCGSA